MKRLRLLLLLVWGGVAAYAQTPTYEYKLMNDLQVSPTIYEFDVYLKRTGATPLEVANTQLGISFNGAIRNSGVLTLSLVASSSEFVAAQVPSSFSVDTLNNILRVAPRSNPGAGSGTVVSDVGDGTKFARLRVTNSVPFSSTTPNLAWNFTSAGGLFPSRLSAYVGGVATVITVPDSHLVNLVNPILNGSISGVAFNDLDGDGTRDAGELGLPGWRVRLSQSGTQVDSTLTDSNGSYGFPNLAPGTYTVSEQMQTGWILTSTPSSYTIVVTTGSFSTNNNFGDFQLAHIDGSKFNDLNGDGVKQPAEPALSNWRIRVSKNGTPVDSMLTDGSGNFSFANLTAGTYTVGEAVQSGWVQTMPSTPGTYTVPVTSGMAATGKIFGNFQYGSVTGQVFTDTDGDGVKDAGETGLAGWQVSFSGPVSGSTTTDPGGNYLLGNLVAGTYTVSENLQGGWVQSAPASPGTHIVVVSSGSAFTAKDFGNYQSGSISGTAFQDLNGNGIKDGGEAGLSNWRIRLTQSGTPVDSALTDGSGNYAFQGLAPGAYTLSEAAKAGWTQTLPASGGSYSVQVTSGSATSGKDFGNFQFASISGTKFNDLNGNGVRDAGEPTLANWRIRLHKAGLEVDSLLTDGSGNYVFTGIANGTYSISEGSQSGWMQTYPSSPGSHSVPVTSGALITGKDFGNYQYGSISGVKFNDLNGNGVKDGGEPGISGWRVRLALNGIPIDSAVTGAGGVFLFDSLTAGTYTLSEAAQAGWTQTFPLAGTYTVNIASGTSATNKDFGNFQVGGISGVKFNDLNGNGLKDVGEPGLPSWTIHLSVGGVQVDSLLTNATGNYSFAGLSAGTYRVSEGPQSGWVETYPSAAGTYDIPIASGTFATNTDFGNFKLGTFSGTAYADLNANGSRDTSDPGQSNWRIRLSRNGLPVDSALTNGSGDYSFSGLTLGTYVVSEVLQAGWFQSSPATPGTYTITVSASGSVVTGLNFGNYQHGSISGTIFNDLNGNGVQDGGEPPLSNWRVHLSGVRADSALTDTAGNYTFANLVPGTYGVAQSVQSGWIQTLPVSQGVYQISLGSGAVELDRDFGNFRTTGIAGVAFNDLNANAVNNVGEPRLGGWRIRLARNGTPADSVLTDSAGAYLFKDLTAGTYTVSEVQQAGWIQSLPASPGTYTIVITSGSSSSANDFGSYQRGGIRGVAYLDINGNGSKDTNDTALPGLRIRLAGAKTDSLLTDATGAYAFTNLTPGNYTVSEQLSSGWILTSPAVPGSYAVTLTSGGDVAGRNFGNFQLASISGTLFNDLNGNGAKDTNDTPLAAWKVELVLNAALRETVVTNASGQYAFANVGPGPYILGELMQNGWVRTAPADPGTYAGTITSGAAFAGKNFGDFQLGSISGTKFDDTNGNGIKDLGEPGLSGWKIRLSGARVDSVTSDSVGHYAFTALSAGAYSVAEELTGGWAQTLPPPPGLYLVAVTSGTNRTNADFGSTLLSVVFGNIRPRWNMLSVPMVPTNGDMRKSTLFPTATGSAYAFTDAYRVKDTLELGRGYWMKFDSAQTTSMAGLGHTWDTIPVNAGWNLIGAPKQTVVSSTIGSIPDAIMQTPFYGYAASYAEAETLKPFSGYWVKVNQAGQLYIPAAGSSTALLSKAGIGAHRSTMRAAESFDGLNYLEIVDAKGNTQRLYFAARDPEQPALGYEMPPLPPAGTFDARFTSDKKVVTYPPGMEKPARFDVRIQAEAFPVTVTWNVFQGSPARYQIGRKSGQKVTGVRHLDAFGSMEITAAPSVELVLSVGADEAVPREYALEQNYPNPFNPSTDIRYALPSQSSVKLTVYNILGEVVETLVDGVEEAGIHQRQWTPDVASGVYFYRLEAKSVTDPNRSFSNVKKMLLVR